MGAGLTSRMKIRDDYRSLSGIEKAAILLLTMGEEVSSKLFAHMNDEEIKDLSLSMSQLGTVNSAIIERIIIEFADSIASTGVTIGNADSTERFLTKVLDRNRAGALLDEIRGPLGKTTWEKLGNINESVLVNYLKNEYPQTVAVILSKIRADHSARVLSLLPEAFSMEVIMRMLRMEAVTREVIDEIERVLRSEFMNNLAKQSRYDTHEAMSEIFNGFPKQTGERYLALLEERNRESAEKIRGLMFQFDDLIRLDPSGVQTLMRAIDKSALSLAMKGAPEQLQDLFFFNMSERAAKMLREEIESLGPVRGKDVAAAQASIVTTAKALADKEEIFLSTGAKGGEDDLIY